MIHAALAEKFTVFVRDADKSGINGLSSQLIPRFRQLYHEEFPPVGYKTRQFIEQHCPFLRWQGNSGSERIVYFGRAIHGVSKAPGRQRAPTLPTIDDSDFDDLILANPTDYAPISSPGTPMPSLPPVAQVIASIETFNFVTPPEDYQALLDIFPENVVEEIRSWSPELYDGLAELVFDLGRAPHLLYTPADMSGLKRIDLNLPEVDLYTIDAIASNLDSFSESDNRAGISGTLHRISRKLNRSGDTIGLSVRAGRSCGLLHNLLEAELASGSSILFVGKPGKGKTTLIRDCAALLAKTKLVEIVDTSNEIAGGGDIPHRSVGRARRMMVPDRSKQHKVMLEAVQNHTAEVLVIDEIGSADEVAAARDVSQRGVQLLASAHGSKIADILASPVLGKLLGGVHTVILNATEAQARAEHTGLAASRSATERMSAPAFDVLVELSRPGCVVVVKNVKEAVDASLGDKPFIVEVRALQGETVQVQEAIMEAGMRS